MASPVYYDKGRQAIYQLYRTVGEEKFDRMMRNISNDMSTKMLRLRGCSKR